MEFKKAKILNIILVLCLPVFISYYITTISSKVIIGVLVVSFISAMLFVYASISFQLFSSLIILLLLITFPIIINILGKNAFSTSTLVIFLIFAWTLSRRQFGLTINSDKFIFNICLLLMGVATVGALTNTPAGYYGPAIRNYINLISSITGFLLIVHAQNIDYISNDKHDYLEKIIATLLVITSIHVLLSFIILNYPDIEKYFYIFLKSNQDNLGFQIRNGIYDRATSVFTGGEEFGELLVVLFPFALYKYFTSSRVMTFFFIVAFLMFGTLISGTRSALILVAIELMVFYCFIPQSYKIRRKYLSLILVSLTIVSWSFLLNYLPLMMDRFEVTNNQLSQSQDFLSLVNRQNVWPVAYNLTKETLSVFGHGPVRAQSIGYSVPNFHCLYLTLIFQFGFIGLVLFLLFFFTIARNLLNSMLNSKYRNNQMYLLNLTCFTSLSCFLVNEIKFEFNRGDAYQQFIWIIFAVYYLTGRIDKEQE